MQHLARLDSLRGLALLAVVWFHLQQGISTARWLQAPLSAGYLGVQLFFLVSAYTMCHMWQMRSGETQASTRFWIRRAARIVPLFWLAMAVYGLLRVSGWMTSSRDITWSDVLWTASLTHSLSPNAFNLVVPGGWSIGVEMLFYWVFPLLVTHLQSAASRLCAGYLWYLVSVPLGPWMQSCLDASPEYLYYSIVTQGPVFLLGMAAHAWAARPEQRSRVPLGILAVWALSTLCLRWLDGGGRAGFWLPVMLMAIGMALVDMHEQPSFMGEWLAQLGRVSYSGYLWHFIVLHVLFTTLNSPIQVHPLYFSIFALACILGTFLVARLSASTLEAASPRLARLMMDRLK